MRGETIRTIELSVEEELRIAEEQNPGHKASLGIGDSVILTPKVEFQAVSLENWRKGQQVMLARAAELAREVESTVA